MPCDALVQKRHRFRVTGFRRILFGVHHARIDTGDFHVFQQHDEIHLFLSCAVDAIPLQFDQVERLALGCGLVQLGG